MRRWVETVQENRCRGQRGKPLLTNPTILQAKMLLKLRSAKQNIRRQDSDKHIYKCFDRVLWREIRLAMLYCNTKKQSKQTDWVPRHLDIQGNEENDLGKRRGAQSPFMSKSTALAKFGECLKNSLNLLLNQDSRKYWILNITSRHSNRFHVWIQL